MNNPVRLTAAKKSYQGWQDSNQNLNTYLAPGDMVDEAMVEYAYEVVPPRTMTSVLVQIGEAYDHAGLGGRARYDTFQRHGGRWFFVGPRMANDPADLMV